MDVNIEVCFLLQTQFEIPAPQLMQNGKNTS